MKKNILLSLLPSEAAFETEIIKAVADESGVDAKMITGFNVIKRSIDSRGKQPLINISLEAFINEPFSKTEISRIQFSDVSRSVKTAIIIGAGPAGLFAALQLIERGIKPIILERGKDVRSRRRDLAILNKEGIVNPESNYCFGEGGAGTYSDGKLYTRSSKRGDIKRILSLLVQFGADENILYDAHPHIGTNKLPHIITAIREEIEVCGAEFYFNKKVVDFIIEKDEIQIVKTADDYEYKADAIILATGHSAKDIFHLLDRKKILIEFKPFALGVRVEHPQSLIDSIQYNCDTRGEYLPAASYSLVQQVDGKGVFSFCMCPGGIIATASTNPGELVVNGWSPSKRNNPFANSGIVVTVEEKDVQAYKKHGALCGMFFQQEVEEKAFQAGGGKFVAPAQRLIDFTKNIRSADLPDCSYLPGIQSANLNEVLPAFVHSRLQQGFQEFGRKLKKKHISNGYFSNEAIVVATESRTSSPVRIPRDKESMQHPQIKNLYPCAEGAGYAGGIVSAAMDGERVANLIADKLL
jgi:uncharacterized protein